MRTLLESFPDEGGQDNDVRADHGGGNSLADTVSGFIHEAAREMTGQHSEHDAHRHDHGGSHGHVHHHAHTHGEMGQGLVPAAESVVDLAESVGVRHIEEVLRDVPDVDGPEASPKSFIYVIVVTMILVLLLVLFIVWSFNLLDEKKKQKTDSQDAGGNFQPIRGRGFDTGNSSLHQRRPQYANNTVFANDNAPLGLPRPHVGAGAVAGAGYALGEVGSAMTLAAQQLQGVVADKTRYMGDTATKVATSLTQSMQQYSAGPLAGYVAGQVQQQMYGQQPKAQQQIQQGYGQATAQQQQFQQQPLPPQHPFYAGTTISSASAGKFPSQGSRNPVVIPPPPIHSNMGQWQGQGQGPAFQSQQQYQRASGGASASPVESSASFYGSQQGSGSRSGYSSDSSDRGSVSSTGRASGSSAVTSSRPAIVNTGDSPAGFGFGFGGLRGSGPLINVLRANAKAGRPDPVHQSQKLTEVAGAGRAGAPKTAPLSFVPLQADLVAKVAGKGAGAGGDVDVSGIMMSALPSLQIGDLAMEHVLGGGAFGQVWRGTWRGTPVAVKVLSGALQRETMPEVELKAFVDEVSMLARLRHPNICLFMGVCIEPPNRAIVTELVTRGSLWDVLRTPDIFVRAAIFLVAKTVCCVISHCPFMYVSVCRMGLALRSRVTGRAGRCARCWMGPVRACCTCTPTRPRRLSTETSRAPTSCWMTASTSRFVTLVWRACVISAYR